MQQSNKLRNSDYKKKYNYYYNQLHKPRKQYDTVQKLRMYFKEGNSTMLFCKGMNSLSCEALQLLIQKFLKQHGSKLEGNFILTKN